MQNKNYNGYENSKEKEYEQKETNTVSNNGGGILVSLIVIVASYAYWQLTRKQADTNNLVTACLNFEMNGGARINLEDAWPISDEEGRNLTGYTFTVENKCEDPVNYIIALESLESTKGLEYLNNNYVKLAIDDEIEKRYGSLDTIENVVLENDTEVIRETKEVTTSTVAGNSINEHTIRIWLSEDAPLTEQNKVFTSRVRITGGQGVENTNVPVTADSCFTIDEKGEIIGYDESCGESVVIPARVNGTQVKTIDTNAFKEEVISTIYYDENSQELTEKPDLSLANMAMVADNCNSLEDLGSSCILIYAISYTDDEEINNYLLEQAQEAGIELYYASDNNVPELLENQLKIYQQIDVSGDGALIAAEKITSEEQLTVTDLDLSKAIYLEEVEEVAFSTFPLVDATQSDTGCVYNSLDIVNIDEYNMPTGLSSLKLGKQSELKLGTGAFAMLNTDNLTVYSNVKAVSNCNNSSGMAIAQPFLSAEITNLTIEPLDGNTIFNPFADSGMFFGSKINNLNISEGITELGKGAFTLMGISDSINLPNSLEKIEYRAFGVSQDNMVITIPDNVNYIGEQAFWLWKNTSTINFTRTEAEVKNQITFGDNWNHNATIVYAQ